MTVYMKKSLFILICFISNFLIAQKTVVKIDDNKEGQKLIVDGKPLMINGMNWDYFPTGTNYSYSLWTQSDEFIKSALDSEMSLLKNMGVNAIRVYSGIPSKWITYIYKNYGIYTMLNHSFGRYGLTIEGNWVANTEYADAKTKELLIKEVKQLAQQYQNTPGLLLYLLGNENNYGLFWEGAETEDIPVEDRKSTQRAQALYQLFNQASVEMKAIDSNHPVAICNGDLLFLDIINKECKNIDILGINAYRGVSFTDLFQRVKQEYGKPVLFTEFGADAFNALSNEEDQKAQAYYLLGNWQEIYENAAGMGKAGNSLGGFTFQFSDGWWKYKQTANLDVHDTNASWSNGGYIKDYEKGDNNMNEEWFGICAKGKTDAAGHYELYPRTAYYALKQVHQFNPYDTNGASKSLSTVNHYFNDINIVDASLRARGDKAALESNGSSKIKLSNLRAEFTTFSTGGSLITTPENKSSDYTSYPNQKGFDHMESYYVGVEANPTSNMKANVNFNILGNVAENPIDQIFYENRGLPVEVMNADGTTSSMTPGNRIQVYNASYNWNH